MWPSSSWEWYHLSAGQRCIYSFPPRVQTLYTQSHTPIPIYMKCPDYCDAIFTRSELPFSWDFSSDITFDVAAKQKKIALTAAASATENARTQQQKKTDEHEKSWTKKWTTKCNSASSPSSCWYSLIWNGARVQCVGFVLFFIHGIGMHTLAHSFPSILWWQTWFRLDSVSFHIALQPCDWIGKHTKFAIAFLALNLLCFVRLLGTSLAL